MKNMRVWWNKKVGKTRPKSLVSVLCLSHRHWPKEQPGFVREDRCEITDAPCEVCEKEATVTSNR